MKIGIIGGGITGLAAGYFLAEHGHQVYLYDRSPKLGGLAGCFEIQGQPVEKFFHNFSRQDTALIGLIHRLGLESQIIFCKARFGFYYVNRTYRFQSPLDCLRFKPLSLRERFRMGFGVFKIRGIRDWRQIDDLSAREWITRQMGARAYETVWKPMLENRFGHDNHERVAASWLWAKLTRGGKSKTAGLANTLGYFHGGFYQMYERLREEIIRRGGRVQSGITVSKICVHHGEATGLETPQGVEPVDAVLATSAIPVFLKLVDDLPEYYRRNLETFRYLGVVCLVLTLKKPLAGTYWLNVMDPTFPFIGVIEHTHLTGELFQGRHLVYIPKYTAIESPYYQFSAEELLRKYIPYLQRMFPAFSSSWVDEVYLWKEPYAQPVTEIGYGSRVPPLETPVRNLYLATMAQIYPADRGMNNGVRQAEEVAARIHACAASLQTKPKLLPPSLTSPLCLASSSNTFGAERQVLPEKGSRIKRAA